MIHFSLFSGIGGFDLAAEWMGWNNYLSCEINDFGNKILEYHFPKAYHHKDITTLNYETIHIELSKRFGHNWRNDDIILTGGFPCQPFSLAGKRKGTNDERYLWHEMLRIISDVKPKFIIAENVFGITNIDGGMVFEQVCADLEAQGYEVQPFIIPACSKNAPHRRDRVWFIAQNPLFSRCIHGKSNEERAEVRKFGDIGTRSADGIHLSKGNATDTNSNGQHQRNCNNEKHTSKRGFDALNDFNEATMHTNGTSKQREHIGQTREGKFNGPDSGNGFNNFQNFPTQSPICSGDDGIPTKLDGITFSKWRNESIKAYGNAIVPQVAFELFKCIEKLQQDL